MLKIMSVLCFLFWGMALQAQSRYACSNGEIYFKSDAPLEVIEARSKEMRGLIDPEKKTFAFSVAMETFKGFNSPLQQVHFNENYMETRIHPKSTFSGKIIEQLDFSQDGTYEVRAKGKLNIHGIEQERIIKSTVVVKGNTIKLTSEFTVLLEEHGITIPKIVYQKIADEIKVNVTATLVKS